MKDKRAIIEGLRHCANNDCNGCPYCEATVECLTKLPKDALALIEGTAKMSEDITFCFYSKCKNKKCERHMSHIKTPYIPHSYAFFKECEHWDIPDVVLEQSGVKDNGYIVRKNTAEVDNG